MGGMGEGGWKGEGRMGGKRGKEGGEGGWEGEDGIDNKVFSIDSRVTYICIWGENQTIVLMGELWDKFLQNL